MWCLFIVNLPARLAYLASDLKWHSCVKCLVSQSNPITTPTWETRLAKNAKSTWSHVVMTVLYEVKSLCCNSKTPLLIDCHNRGRTVTAKQTWQVPMVTPDLDLHLRVWFPTDMFQPADAIPAGIFSGYLYQHPPVHALMQSFTSSIEAIIHTQ